jgi:hypothetical protein
MITNQLFGESVFKRMVWLYGAYMLLSNLEGRSRRNAPSRRRVPLLCPISTLAVQSIPYPLSPIP